MAVIAEQLDLGPNEFAFHFETSDGVDADALANFLKRAATVARQRGAELRIVGLREGSLAVIVDVIKKGASKEFAEKPIDTTIKVSTFAAAIVGAIVLAMTPTKSGDTPLGKAGAEVVENHHVTKITVVTSQDITVVMDETIAFEVREAERNRQVMLAGPEEVMRLPHRVAEMIEDARQGNLSGQAALIGDELHFRPDGYRYWVPVDENPVSANGALYPGGNFRVGGRIAMRDGLPDRIIVDWAEPKD